MIASFAFIGNSINTVFPHFSSNLVSQFSASDQADLPASTFFVDSVTEKSLKKVYENAKDRGRKVRILVVPGHDRQSWGTQFNGLKEVDLNLELGEELFDLLSQESLFDVYISQTKNGYTKEFLTYFEDQKEETAVFVAEQKGLMQKYLTTGKIHSAVRVVHNDAPNDVAMRLYGINKWANEKGIDIVIHIHFNDYPGRRLSLPGKYSGFSIYVPESQYSNAKGSMPPAESVHNCLIKFYAESNLPIEDDGVVEDQELIAIGSNNSLDSAAMLIEYGYIYEPAFIDPSLRSVVLSDLALQTYLGVLDFFEDDNGNDDNRASARANAADLAVTRFLPHKWQSDLKKDDESAPMDVLSLQTALTLEGLYPPPGRQKNDCSLTGYFGPCTELAVRAFQERHEIYPAEGFVGAQTREKLNKMYGVEQI